MEDKTLEVLMLEVDWRKLQQSSEGVLMLRVALAVNDIASANYLLWHTTTGTTQVPDYFRDALQLYGLRLRLGHLHEAVQLIHKVHKTHNLAKYIQQLEPETLQNYKLLLRLQIGNSDFSDYEKYVSNVRNKLVFHYDPGEVCQALNHIANDDDASCGRVIVGKAVGYSRLVMADDIMRRELCAVLWGIENATPDVTEKELLDALGWTHERIQAFHDFGTELCTLYFAGLQPKT